MADNNNTSGGIGIGMILFIVFLILKLTGNIDWSWWFVTIPLWLPLATLVAVLLVVGIVGQVLKK